MRIWILVFLFSFIQFIGCSYYGSISNNSVKIKFPIKLDSAELNHLGNNWSTDSTYGGTEHGAFRLINDSITYLKINELVFKGLYKVQLTFYPDDWCEIKDNSYLFYEVDVQVLDGTAEMIYDSLQLQPILLVLGGYNGTQHFYDMDNNMRYSINTDYGWFLFQGLEYLRDPNHSDYRHWLDLKKNRPSNTTQ